MRDRFPIRARVPLGAFAVCVAGLALGPLSAGFARDKKQPEKVEQLYEKAVLAEFLDDAKNYTIRIVKPDTALKLRERSVLASADPERKDGSSVFVWLDEGRPVVIGRIFQYQTSGRRVKKHSLHSLAVVELEAKFGDKLAWAPGGRRSRTLPRWRRRRSAARNFGNSRSRSK